MEQAVKYKLSRRKDGRKHMRTLQNSLRHSYTSLAKAISHKVILTKMGWTPKDLRFIRYIYSCFCCCCYTPKSMFSPPPFDRYWGIFEIAYFFIFRFYVLYMFNVKNYMAIYMYNKCFMENRLPLSISLKNKIFISKNIIY